MYDHETKELTYAHLHGCVDGFENIKVREVNPEYDAAVEGLVTELKNQSCVSNGCGNGWQCGRCNALAAFEKAKAGLK